MGNSHDRVSVCLCVTRRYCIKTLTAGPVRRANMHVTKPNFVPIRRIVEAMAVFRFFKMAAARHLDF